MALVSQTMTPRTGFKLVRSSSMSSNTYRALLTVPLHAQRSYLVLSSRPTISYHITAVASRKRSTWGRAVISNTPKHDKHCRWLNARDGDLQQFRDPHCEGCSAEGNDIFGVMSSSTLSWYRKIQQLRTRGLTEDQALTTWVESDPYSVLFGNSERRLRGLSPLMPLLVDRSRPVVSDRLERQRAEYLKERESPNHPRTIFRTAQMASQPGSEARTESTNTQARSTQSSPSSYSTPPVSAERVFQQPAPIHVPKVADAVAASDNLGDDVSITKHTLERSYADIRKETKTLSKDIKKVTTNDTPAETLGRAWRNHQASKTATLSNKPLSGQQSVTTRSEPWSDSTRSTLESAWATEQQHPRSSAQQSKASMLSGIPHFIGRSVQPRSVEAQMTYMSILTKDKPLRHMRGYELGMHRARLLASWAVKSDQQDLGERPKVQVKLDEEVANQKRAFTAFEGKWSLRDEAQFIELARPFVPASQPVSENKELAAEKEEGNSLVREVREIYEHTYGVIDAKHRQADIQKSPQEQQTGPSKPVLKEEPVTSSGSATQQFGASLGSAFDEYESRTGGYGFKSGQDQLEKEVKNKGVSDQMWTAMDPALSRQKGPSSKEPARFAAKAAPEPAKVVVKQGLEGQSPSPASTTAPAPAQGSGEQSTPPAATPASAPAEIGVLTYNSDTQSVRFMPLPGASATTENVIPVLEALSRLNHPGKFIHRLRELPQDQPYDIITAKDDLLIVKFTRHGQVDGSNTMSASLSSNKTAVINPVDGTSVPQSPRTSSSSASAPQDVEVDTALGNDSTTQDESTAVGRSSEVKPARGPQNIKSSRFVRKQEPVFSGRALRSRSREWTDADKATLENLVTQGRSSNKDIAAYLQKLRGMDSSQVPEVAMYRQARTDVLHSARIQHLPRMGKLVEIARELSKSRRIISSLRSELEGLKAAWSTSELEHMLALRNTAAAQAEATSSPSTAELVEASRFPSSFLHSTRTYMPETSSLGSGAGSGGNGSGIAHQHGADSNDSSRHRGIGSLKRKALAVASILGFMYAVGIVVENLRDRELEFRWSTTPGSSAGSTVPSTPTEAAAPLVSPSSLPSPPPPHPIATSAPYTRTAWLDDIRPPHSARTYPSKSPSPSSSSTSTSSTTSSPFATTLATATPAAAGFEPEDGGSFALRDEMRADGAMQYATEQERAKKQQEVEREQQEELGALEAAFAAGAGVAVAVGVLLGGFGGGGS